MKSKIFKHIFLVAMAVFVSCIALTMCSLYSYFSAEHNAEMKEEANYVAAAVEENGIDFLRHRRTSSTTRVTWIDTDGTVLYDSVANPAEMENHGEREEIREPESRELGRAAAIPAPWRKRQPTTLSASPTAPSSGSPPPSTPW